LAWAGRAPSFQLKQPDILPPRTPLVTSPRTTHLHHHTTTTTPLLFPSCLPFLHFIAAWPPAGCRWNGCANYTQALWWRKPSVSITIVRYMIVRSRPLLTARNARAVRHAGLAYSPLPSQRCDSFLCAICGWLMDSVLSTGLRIQYCLRTSLPVADVPIYRFILS